MLTLYICKPHDFHGEPIAAVVAMFALYAPTICALSYLLSFPLSKPSSAQGVIFAILYVPNFGFCTFLRCF